SSWTCRRESTRLRSPKSGDGRKVGILGGTLRPMWITIRQTFIATFRRRPVTVLYPYDRVELPKAYRGQHSIDWYKCIGCELCAKVCPNECIYFDIVEVEKDSPYLHPSRAELDEMKHVIRRPGVDVGHCLFCGKCIGCQQCVDVCPVDCLHMEETEHKSMADFVHIDRVTAGTPVILLEEAVAKK